ncbi:hypothetical protein ACIP10_26845 [Streptomyces galbus]
MRSLTRRGTSLTGNRTTGVLVLLASLIFYVDPTGDIATSDGISFATWI